ncbi:MAG: hypothetical protein MSC31_10385 [Solirubrobacteraceae bacterium MAG38_C4-C5]|nr:hypothetical protein [Candidatus Siliceabacter maunaloa]
MPDRRPSFRSVAPSASPQEAAAITAALEQFFRATAAPQAPTDPRPDRWARTHLLESVHREPPGLGAWGGDPSPWHRGD